jgi:hypothetical protein
MSMCRNRKCNKPRKISKMWIKIILIIKLNLKKIKAARMKRVINNINIKIITLRLMMIYPRSLHNTLKIIIPIIQMIIKIAPQMTDFL